MASKREGPKCHVCVQCGRSFVDLPTRGSREKCKNEELVKCDHCVLAVRSENDLKDHVKDPHA
ncbi:hypothetical protein DPMN_035229 [Dreissena polymorpha]|uniref:C2H2-type domain-containing protein n=1 Tax=Dreissena polymorpha TaxID=45954 RepID=A0A9D4M9A4_DREPO|nr:hypothetical protein DPMN_035229 [Dreissena polymorpha]